MKKKKLYLLLIANLHVVSLWSQPWSTLGNNLGGGEILGSTNNFPVDFYTNGLQRMRIATNGFLGLGVATPQSFLHIHDGGLSYLHVTNNNTTNGART